MNSFEKWMEQKYGLERSQILMGYGMGQGEKFTPSELKEAYKAGMLRAADIEQACDSPYADVARSIRAVALNIR